jgi:HD-GYP domain-containing protein (c-di-GMP phosphodiesterase class II)
MLSEELTPGMVVGRAILDPNGRMLLAAGQELNLKYIKRIQDLDIPSVYIEDQLGVEDSPPPVSPQVIARANALVKESYQKCARTGKLNIRAIKGQVDNIIDELTANSHVMIGISDLKSYDDYTYQHSVSVCVLAVMIGISHGYNRSQLEALGIGALLHDIGKITVPREILNKPGKLTDEEFTTIKKHPWEGFNIIKESGGLSLLSAHVALQHHERYDGKGYPRALAGDKIHEYGLITAVADVYDALVSDRPYRRGYNNQEATNIIEEGRDTQLSSYFIDLLFGHINLYPPGTVVKLTTRDTAMVIKENPNDSKRPVVRLLYNAQQQIYDKDHVVDLSVYKTVFIILIVNSADAAKYIASYISYHNKNSAGKSIPAHKST